MKKMLIALLICVMIVLCGCGGDDNNRFVKVADLGNVCGNEATMWIDKETGVCYARAGSGFSVMLDSDGKPLIYEKDG